MQPKYIDVRIVAFVLSFKIDALDIQTPGEKSWKSARLPDNIRPMHYNLIEKPYIYNEREPPWFEGSVEIYFRCSAATRLVVLNAKGLTFNSTSLSYHEFKQKEEGVYGIKHNFLAESFDRKKRSMHILHISHDEQYETVTIIVEKHLKPGHTYILEITFKGFLAAPGTGRGIYWTFNDGRKLAATHFSPVSARRAWPCFDEPALKATFNISVWRHPHMKTLSNTAIRETEIINKEWCVDHYSITPLMSSYLVAFVVHDYSFKKVDCSNGVTVKIWTRRGGLSQIDFALSKVCDLLIYFKRTTGIGYTLSKLDIVTMPNHLVSAMENWGLITYREDSLWYNSALHTYTRKLDVILTLAHELAHTWYGNLVTPAWWSDLWLKEGFATHFMYQAVQFLYPNWPMENLEVARSLHIVLGADGTSIARPIVMDVTKPWELYKPFNQQTYAKAASVLRMLKYFIGSHRFHSCVKKFLVENAYGSVETSDFFKSCTSTSGVNITKFLRPWIYQRSYPVVSVKTISEVSLSVEQKPFYSVLNHSTSNREVWPVPLYSSLLRKKAILLMTSKSGNLHIGGLKRLSTIERLLLNSNQTGYYRVQYDTPLRTYINHVLVNSHERIPVLNRAQYLDDVYRLARMDKSKEVDALEATRYMKGETEYLPWHTFILNLDFVTSLISQTELWPQFKEYLLSRMEAVYITIPWTKPGVNNIEIGLLREELLLFACKLDHPRCRETSVQIFRHCFAEKACQRLDPDIRQTVLCLGVRLGNSSTWAYVFSLYQEHADNFGKDILYALACSQNQSVLQKYMDTIMSGRLKNEVDAIFAINKMIGNNLGQEMVWKHLISSWNNYPLGFSKGSILLFLSSAFCTEGRFRELTKFISAQTDMIFGELYQMAIELTTDNIRWLEENYESIKFWLLENSQQKDILPQSVMDKTFQNTCSFTRDSLIYIYVAMVQIVLKLYH